MPLPPSPHNPERFELALRQFDEENARDPNVEIVEGVAQPRELLYSLRLTKWVERLCPEASEELRLAARCQHLCRWVIPRESHPMTRAGYLRWREDLKRFHAQKAGEILREAGYEEQLVKRVQSLNLKENFPQDRDVRILEDALCLVFLEHQLADLARKAGDEKVIGALQKSWRKMTPQGREFALTIRYGTRERLLLDRALHPGQDSRPA